MVTTSMLARFKKRETKELDNESERKRILESSSIQQSGRKSPKLLSLQPERDLETYSKETRGSLGTEKTRTQLIDGSSVQPRWSSRHSGHKFRGCSGNIEFRERRDLRLERLSSKSDKNTGLGSPADSTAQAYKRQVLRRLS